MNSSDIIKMNLILLNLGDTSSVIIAAIVDETPTEVMLNMPITLHTVFDAHLARVGAYVNRYMGFSSGPIVVKKDKIVSMAKPAEHMVQYYKDFLYSMSEEEVLKYEMRVLDAVDPSGEEAAEEALLDEPYGFEIVSPKTIN